jgi:hypothetical protein
VFTLLTETPLSGKQLMQTSTTSQNQASSR